MKIGIIAHRNAVREALKRAPALLRPEHEIVWVARTVDVALELCERVRPELLLMELMPRVSDGVEATRRIMSTMPCSIVLISCGISDVAAEQIFQCMGHGALDAVDIVITQGGWVTRGAAEFARKIDSVAALIAERRSESSDVDFFEGSGTISMPPPLVAIGASSGGPTALAAILRRLPPSFPAAVLIVQHVDPRFSRGLARWLRVHARRLVRLAQENDRPEPGTVLIANGGAHLKLKSSDRIGYTMEPRNLRSRPCIDVLFESVASMWPPGKAAGVLLTGTGRDGAAGLQAMHRRGHCTIVQDPRTSVAPETPRRALALEPALRTVPLERIAEHLIEFAGAEAHALPLVGSRVAGTRS